MTIANKYLLNAEGRKKKESHRVFVTMSINRLAYNHNWHLNQTDFSLK